MGLFFIAAGTPGKQPENTSSLQRSVVMKRHSLSQSASASPHLKAHSLKCENSKSEDVPNKPTTDVFTPENSSTPLKQPQKSLKYVYCLLVIHADMTISVHAIIEKYTLSLADLL